MAKFEIESKFNVGDTVTTGTNKYKVKGIQLDRGRGFIYKCEKLGDGLTFTIVENRLTLVKEDKFTPFENAAELYTWYLRQEGALFTISNHYFVTLMHCLKGTDIEVGTNGNGELCWRTVGDDETTETTLQDLIEMVINDNINVMCEIHEARIELAKTINGCDDAKAIEELRRFNIDYQKWDNYNKVLDDFLEEVK